MKLNPDCVRDILLLVEESCDYENYLDCPSEVPESLKDKYSTNELFYHIKQCELSGLIRNVTWFADGESCSIRDLDPLGHQFLADIRSDTNWNKTKDIAQKVGSTSLDVISKIASEVIASLLKSQI